MPIFPSHDWMEEYCARVREHPDAPELSAGLDGLFRFVVEPGGPVTERQTYDVAVTPVDGSPPDVEVVEVSDARPRLTVTADYNRWRQLVDGELDIGLAVMLRRVKVSGDVAALARGLANTRPLLDAIGEVETIWME